MFLKALIMLYYTYLHIFVLSGLFLCGRNHIIHTVKSLTLFSHTYIPWLSSQHLA